LPEQTFDAEMRNGKLAPILVVEACRIQQLRASGHGTRCRPDTRAPLEAVREPSRQKAGQRERSFVDANSPMRHVELDVELREKIASDHALGVLEWRRPLVHEIELSLQR